MKYSRNDPKEKLVSIWRYKNCAVVRVNRTAALVSWNQMFLKCEKNSRSYINVGHLLDRVHYNRLNK